jgi:hypothetical protein
MSTADAIKNTQEVVRKNILLTQSLLEPRGATRRSRRGTR